MQSLNVQSLPSDIAGRTRALQSAIDSISASGGGCLHLEAGVYACGSIELKSGVELRLGHGARLLACEDRSLFPAVGRHDAALTANHGFGALLRATDARDIAVTGTGTLDGGGAWDACPDWTTAQKLDHRPAVAYFENCRQVLFDALNIVGAKWWTLHLLRCEDVMMRGLRMRNNWPNSDGIDPDGCRNVIISDCHLICGDDCIVAKSTQGDACENVTVSNCILETTCACLKLGTESRGVFRNFLFTNCVVKGDVGVGLYMKDGGVMENVLATQILFDTGSAYPILIDAMPRDYRSGKPAGSIRNVGIVNCQARGPGRIWIEGTAADPLENISVSDIDWQVTGPLPSPAIPKPLGSARVILDPARPAYEEHPAQVIALNVNGLRARGIRLSGHTEGRQVLWTEGVSRLDARD